MATLDNGIFKIPSNFSAYSIQNLPDNSPVNYAFYDQDTSLFFFDQKKNIYKSSQLGQWSNCFNYNLYTHNKNSFVKNDIIVKDRFVFFNNTIANGFKTELFWSKITELTQQKVHSVTLDYSHSGKIFVDKNKLYLSINNAVIFQNIDLLNASKPSQQWQTLKHDESYKLAEMTSFESYNEKAFLTNGSLLFLLQKDSLIFYDSLQLRNIKRIGPYLLGFNPSNILCAYHLQQKKEINNLFGLSTSIWDKSFKLNGTSLLVADYNNYYFVTMDKNNQLHYQIIENAYIPKDIEFALLKDSSCYCFKDGKLIKIGLADLLKKQSTPQIYLTKINFSNLELSLDDSVFNGSYKDTREIYLSFDIAYFRKSNWSFEYQINQERWLPLSNPEIVWSNLEAGKHLIHLRAYTADRLISSKIKSIQIIIEKPFWQQWWFLILMGVLITSLVVSFFLLRLRFVLAKREKAYFNKISILKSEYKALNALMNPHFVFNALNSVQRLIDKNDQKGTSKFMQILAKLIRQNLHNLDKELITLSKELELVENYLQLEQLRFKEQLQYQINIDKQVDPEEILIPPLLLQPLVENSIKHGRSNQESGQTIIALKVNDTPEGVLVEVVDNSDTSTATTNTSPSAYSFKNIAARMQQLNEIYGIQIKVNYHKNELGFSVQILILDS